MRWTCLSTAVSLKRTGLPGSHSDIYHRKGAAGGGGYPAGSMGFIACYMDFTVLKRYRDFDDSTRETENLFEYDCEVSNWDGLA